MPTILNQYTPEQQRRLKLAPFAVFEAIAGADGIIESKERQDFIDHIKTYDTKEHPLAHAVMEAIGEEPAEMMKILGESTNDPSSLYHLSTTMEAAWQTPEVEEFREDLFNLGLALTGAFPTLTASETMALSGLAVLLETAIEDHPARSDRLSPVVAQLRDIEMGASTN
ncbi:MAG: hypothetical protein VX610_00165 [SAR324 cluster bacterium]|nr:hypothetical protein [SAR324 cluster bacterium]